MNFDDIIKEKLDSYQAPNNAGAWKEFESQFAGAAQTTTFAGPLIGGIAAAVVMTVLFTTLPDIKSDSIESIQLESNDIEIGYNPTVDGTSNEIIETTEHIAQEDHSIPLLIVKEEALETESKNYTNQDPSNTAIDVDLTAQSANTKMVPDNDNSARNEDINFTASGIQCPNSTITFTAKLQKAASVTWVFDGLEVKNGLQVKHSFKEAGEYAARMIVKFSDGYEQSITQSVEVYETPTASFGMNTISNASCFDQMLELKGTPNSNTYKWVIDGDTVGKGSELSYAISKDLHTVGMHTINEWGCTSYEDKSLKVESGLRLDIPTAFSPTRQDGLNDTWKVVGLNNMASYHIVIKRVSTNQVVFESKESIEWDGSISGSFERIEAGEVFTYQITATDDCGRTRQFTNTIRYL